MATLDPGALLSKYDVAPATAPGSRRAHDDGPPTAPPSDEELFARYVGAVQGTPTAKPATREPAATLDLRGATPARAVDRLRAFLTDGARLEHAALLVVHGDDDKLIAVVRDGLDAHPAVDGHVPAPAKHGGRRARLVRLRRV